MDKQNNLPKLEFGKYYHIYNNGIGKMDLFYSNENYKYFLNLYGRYIDPISDTFAWCLLRNHFHLFVRIYNRDEINHRHLSYTTVEQPKKLDPSKQFSNLFNSYTQAINKQRQRKGSLFSKPFQRKEVSSENYFRHLVYYIHNNPVHHGFCETMTDYQWSSYLTMISIKPTKIKRDTIVGCFDGKGNFVDFHRKNQKLDIISHLIIE